MNKILTILKKEVCDNLRDRQTVFYALLFGPILMPLLIAGSVMASMNQLSIDYEEISNLAVVNAEAAPNLIQFLREHNIDVVAPPDDYLRALRAGDISLVLEIMPLYASNMRAGKPAPVTLHSNDSDKDSTHFARRISSLLDYHARIMASLRLQIRGLDPAVFNVIEVLENDVSSEGAGGQILASLLPFLFIISMVMGGFYLAVDTTAGERERHSLEPLMSLPVERWQLTLGKYLATLVFISASGVLTAVGVYLIFRFVPANPLTSLLRFDGYAITKAFLLASPLIFFITGLLIAVAAFTRSTKEAQTYLGLLMVIPMAPFFLLQFINIKSAATVMALPMLSQYKLLEKVAKNDLILPLHIALSFAGTLAGAAVLLYAAIYLYRRDRILR